MNFIDFLKIHFDDSLHDHAALMRDPWTEIKRVQANSQEKMAQIFVSGGNYIWVSGSGHSAGIWPNGENPALFVDDLSSLSSEYCKKIADHVHRLACDQMEALVSALLDGGPGPGPEGFATNPRWQPGTMG